MSKNVTVPPENPPQDGRNATAAVPTTGTRTRGARGRFVKKGETRACVRDGSRKARTARGAVKHRDKFVRRGQDAATAFWNDTNCHPKDARRRTLAILESEIGRIEDQMGPDYKPHGRDLEVKPLTARYDMLVERRDSLWAELRQTYSPVLAAPVKDNVVRFCILEGLDGRAELFDKTTPPPTEAVLAILSDIDNETATVDLKASGVESVTPELIKAFWAGRTRSEPITTHTPPATARKSNGKSNGKTNGTNGTSGRHSATEAVESKPTVEPAKPTVRTSTTPPPEPAPAATVPVLRPDFNTA